MVNVRTVFWEVNGERIKFDEDEYKRYREYVENGEVRCVYAGYVKHDFGGFEINVCAGIEDEKLVIYVVKDWAPSLGYSWSESEVKKIVFD